MDLKKIFQIIIVIAAILITYFTAKSYIKSEVDRNTLKEKESHAIELAERTLDLEKKRIASETKLKEQIILLEKKLGQCQIELDEIQKKKELSELSKKNPKKFRETIDKTLGVKGKKK